MTVQQRVLAGVPAGGQFAASARPETATTLTAAPAGDVAALQAAVEKAIADLAAAAGTTAGARALADVRESAYQALSSASLPELVVKRVPTYNEEPVPEWNDALAAELDDLRARIAASKRSNLLVAGRADLLEVSKARAEGRCPFTEDGAHQLSAGVCTECDFGATEQHLVCPACRGDCSVTAVDRGERWTDADEDGVDYHARSVSFSYDGDTDFDGAFYKTTCCEQPVCLPDGWSEE